MTVVRLEILKREDVELLIQLAKRLHVEKIEVSENWEDVDLPVGGLPLSDSELDAHKTIEEQFNLLRISDNDRYPAYFTKHGFRYILKIYKEDIKL